MRKAENPFKTKRGLHLMRKGEKKKKKESKKRTKQKKSPGDAAPIQNPARLCRSRDSQQTSAAEKKKQECPQTLELSPIDDLQTPNPKP